MTIRGTYPSAIPRMGRRLSHVDIGGISDLTVWLESTWGVERDSSGNVSQVRDRTGRGNHATQATAGARPTFALVNGRPVLQTTKAARFLEIAASLDYAWSDKGLSIYAVARSSSAVAAQYHVGCWAAAPAGERRWLLGLNDSNVAKGGGYASEVGTNADRQVIINEDCSTGSPRVQSLHITASGLSLYGQAGATRYGPTAMAGQRSGTPASLCIGRIFAADVTLGADCDFSALIVCRRMLSTVEDAVVRNYLAQQHGAS